MHKSPVAQLLWFEGELSPMNGRRLVAASATMLALTGCSAGSLIPGASPSPTPEVTYDSVTELRDAAVEDGYDCPDWRQTNVVKNAAQSGNCSSADVFSIDLSEEDAPQTIDGVKSLGTEVHVLTGGNWIINAPTAELSSLKEALGGTIVQYSGTVRLIHSACG